MTADLNHYFGGDLGVTPIGGVQIAIGATAGQQRVLRRLLTNPAILDASGNVLSTGDYLWHQDYGAGLPALVGSNVSAAEISAIIDAQMLLEQCVAQSPAPSVVVAPIAQGVSVQIRYVDAASGEIQAVAFDVTK